MVVPGDEQAESLRSAAAVTPINVEESKEFGCCWPPIPFFSRSLPTNEPDLEPLDWPVGPVVFRIPGPAALKEKG
jgi:hypothetical protein